MGQKIYKTYIKTTQKCIFCTKTMLDGRKIMCYHDIVNRKEVHRKICKPSVGNTDKEKQGGKSE